MSIRALAATLALAFVAGVLSVQPASAQTDQTKRIRDATTILNQIMSIPDKGIPTEILEKAEAVAVIPGLLKAGFIVGGEHGRGILSVRNRQAGTWSDPAFLSLGAGSVGLQIGGESTDLVLVIMDQKAVDSLMSDKFKIGGDVSAAAGPVGASTETPTASILSYSRSKGAFAGISLNGAELKADEDSNKAFYGQPLKTADITGAAPSDKSTVGTSGGNPAALKPADEQAVNEWRQMLSRYSGAAKH